MILLCYSTHIPTHYGIDMSQMVILNANAHRLFRLEIRVDNRQTEITFFRSEENLLEVFPDAKWAGLSSPTDKNVYTRGSFTDKEVEAMGNNLYETAYPS